MCNQGMGYQRGMQDMGNYPRVVTLDSIRVDIHARLKAIENQLEGVEALQVERAALMKMLETFNLAKEGP